MYILLLSALVFIGYILFAEIYIDIKQRYKDWSNYGHNENNR